MNGPEHFKAAEKCIEDAQEAGACDPESESVHLRYAQVHATLAAAAAQMDRMVAEHYGTSDQVREWRQVLA